MYTKHTRAIFFFNLEKKREKILAPTWHYRHKSIKKILNMIKYLALP